MTPQQKLRPTVAGFLRGIALGAALFVVEAIAHASGKGGLGLPSGLAEYAPLIALGARTIEGALDELRQKSR